MEMKYLLETVQMDNFFRFKKKIFLIFKNMYIIKMYFLNHDCLFTF